MASDFPSFEPTAGGPRYEDEVPVAPEARAEELAEPPPRPQPGFWLGALATACMYIVCQIGIPLVVVVAYLLVRFAPSGDPMKKLTELADNPEGTKEFQRIIALPGLVAAHVPTFIFGLIALRIFAGRYWYREIAVRLPSLPHFILLLLGFPALPILAGGAYWLAQMYLPGLGELASIILSLAQMVAYLGLFWLIFRFKLRYDPKQYLAGSPIRLQLGIGTILAITAVGVLFVSYQLFSRVVPSIPYLTAMDKSMEEAVEDARNWHPIVAVLVIAVMPAFSEEIWCRAFLGRGLVGQYGAVCGVLITSFYFGAIHVLPHQGAMAMLMGLALHYAYITTRSLLAPMLLHFLNNATSVLGDRLGDVAANVDIGPAQIPLTLYGCGIVLLAAVGWSLYQSRARIVYPEGTPDHPLGYRAYPGVAMPSQYSSATISRAWPSLAACALSFAAFGAFATVFVLVTVGYRLP